MSRFSSSISFGIDASIAYIGVLLAFAAKDAYYSYKSNRPNLNKLRRIPQVPISGLRSLISSNESQEPPLVFIRGLVAPKLPDVLVWSRGSEERAVVVMQVKQGEDLRPKSLTKIPFVLVPTGFFGRGGSSMSDYVNVSLDDSSSKHSLPLTNVYNQLVDTETLIDIDITPDIGEVLVHEEILPVGQEISAVGRIYDSKDSGGVEIRPCEGLPFFLSKDTKAEMVLDVWRSNSSKLWLCVILGSLSVGVLVYVYRRIWRRWQKRKKVLNELGEMREEDAVGVPEGELCGICLMERKTYVFVPCGHLLCCRTCAYAVRRGSPPDCPLCRRTITDSVRLFP